MKPSDLPPDFSVDTLIAEANRCVACGLCLPHCPTYRITLSEADSPRGRIALMSGVASNRIPMNARFVQHIDRCLTCRACEAVCPNHVSYGKLVDGTRAMISSSSPDLLREKTTMQKSRFRRWVENEMLANSGRLDALRPLLRFYQGTGLQKAVRKSGILGKTKFAVLEGQLPPIGIPRSLSSKSGVANAWQTVYSAIGNPRGEVGLFLGCIARLTDVVTLNSTIFVLNHLGYTVHVPSAQTCCGALHQHGGDRQAAMQLARRNIRAFEELGLNLHAIISTASGCGAQMTEYPLSNASETPEQSILQALHVEEAEKFSAKVMDISAFLIKAEGWDNIKPQPLPHKIAVHEPCSLRNVLRGSAHPYALLARIPGAKIVPLAGNDQCCGAAGTYFLDQPEMAQRLLHDKMTTLEASDARYLATSNVGCAMHIASALREAGSQIEVLHPVTLLARQMGMPA
ncbi:(Fe-S)-binding protein [Nitrosospira sp. NpAV]|uniref:(Fe-S)-binding protein n=1 Tax=Nitrosospira sp. NpAV TaxID=58133 RepID=UPI0005A1C5F2|nr:(Fe-S)-binding protein [Nitrosospira sp. NpAV]KIO49732.1 glycolate oxidase [Nitrosospira sp. NpAV]